MEAESRIRRILLQQLESWQRAGVTHLPRAVPMAAAVQVPPARPVLQPDPVRPTAALVDPIPVLTPAASLPAVTPVALPPRILESVALMRDSGDSVPAASTLSLDERRAQLKVLAERVAACTRCEELARTRTQTVFGVGNPQAKVLFLGEAPGADEDKTGEPFVGRAGQLLNKIIEAMKLTREEIYICNILRCRPPENRNPSPPEAANCREHLDGQLATVDPEYIVCWGTVAAQNLLGVTDSIGKLRKRFFAHGRAKVLCTYHPSYLLRNPAAKKDVWEDMQLLMKELGIPVK